MFFGLCVYVCARVLFYLILYLFSFYKVEKHAIKVFIFVFLIFVHQLCFVLQY